MALFLTIGVDDGTTASEVAVELCRLVEKIGIAVEAEVGEAMMMARPYQLVKDVLMEYERELRLQNYPSS